MGRLSGMRERVNGGRPLQIASGAQGTLVQARLPAFGAVVAPRVTRVLELTHPTRHCSRVTRTPTRLARRSASAGWQFLE